MIKIEFGKAIIISDYLTGFNFLKLKFIKEKLM